jgi:cell division protein FtsZ
LNNNDITGAKNILLNITSGNAEVTMDEIGDITEHVQNSAGSHANLIWGNGIDQSLGDKINITIIATGFSADVIPEIYVKKERIKTVVSLSGKVENRKISDDTNRSRSYEFDTKDDNYTSNGNSTNSKKSKYPAANQMNTSAENYTSYANQNQQSNVDIELMENIPAYKRKNIDIENFNQSADSEISRFSISDDPEIGLNRNSYLDDNVD